jgi:hypothetical protein
LNKDIPSPKEKGGIMNSRYISVLLASAVAGLAFSQPALSEDDTCAGIDWKPQILERFAGIDQACQEIVLRDGKKFARFEVKLIRARADGNVTVQMRLRDGSRVEGTFFAPRGFHVQSHSGQTTFHMNELSRGDILDVYIPQNRIESAAPGKGSA